MRRPYSKQVCFSIGVAPDAIHVASIAEMEAFCLRVSYECRPILGELETPEGQK